MGPSGEVGWREPGAIQQARKTHGLAGGKGRGGPMRGDGLGSPD